MIKNIPNKYNSELLREKIDVDFKNKYDFFYLPMDLKVFLFYFSKNVIWDMHLLI
jgi:hypothetical protein